MHNKQLFLTFSFRENFQLIRPVRRCRVLLCVAALSTSPFTTQAVLSAAILPKFWCIVPKRMC